ncbi:MAG: helix-turn-helix domain-containing protein [Terracidiphilus sp.]
MAARNTPQKVVFRVRIVLLAAEGKANSQIAQQLGTSRPSVILPRRRFQQGGTAALSEDARGRGRKATISAARVKQIVEATLHTKPPAATDWSLGTMARAQGVSPATVQRTWDAHGLELHRTRTFKLSRLNLPVMDGHGRWHMR